MTSDSRFATNLGGYLFLNVLVRTYVGFVTNVLAAYRLGEYDPLLGCFWMIDA
jgi:hypothetical protein